MPRKKLVEVFFQEKQVRRQNVIIIQTWSLEPRTQYWSDCRKKIVRDDENETQYLSLYPPAQTQLPTQEISRILSDCHDVAPSLERTDR